MKTEESRPIDVLIVAVPETAGSALYGMLDVLSSVGSIWQTLVRSDDVSQAFSVQIVSNGHAAFSCGNGIPVSPNYSVDDDPAAPIIILPEMWLGPDEDLHNRHAKLIDWIRRKYDEGSAIYSACSGAIMLAETGLLDGCHATSHWGYQDLFRKHYPKVQFDPAPNLCYADPEGRIVTAGGTTSWHDLALHIISRYVSPGEALRIAKVYLLKWHSEGDLPYAQLVRPIPHGDSIVRKCEEWLTQNFSDIELISKVTEMAGIPERTLKRRFKAATGNSLIEYVQNLRIEEAKRLLEEGNFPVEEISAEVGYSDTSFFRRVFKRLTGLTPSHYRRLFSHLTTVESGRASMARP